MRFFARLLRRLANWIDPRREAVLTSESRQALGESVALLNAGPPPPPDAAAIRQIVREELDRPRSVHVEVSRSADALRECERLGLRDVADLYSTSAGPPPTTIDRT